MAWKALPDPDTLRKVLEYDPASGALAWRERPRHLFPPTQRGEQAFAVWNRRFSSRAALTSKRIDGYYCGRLFDENVLAHRVIWKLVTGEEPDHIDHIDGDPANNRWANLRATDASGNVRNLGISRANRSGAIGVRYRDDRNRWIAYIGAKPRQTHLGTFWTKGEAVSARLAAERRLGFEPTHGSRRARDWSFQK